MPDFEKLNHFAIRLGQLTSKENIESGLSTWNIATGEVWKEIVEMWYKPELVPPIFYVPDRRETDIGGASMNRQFLNLNDYARLVHEANKKWWVCLKCDENGDYRGQCSVKSEHCPPHAHLAYLKCPFCNGTKVAKRNVGEMIALMHSELSEALEGDRKGLKDDKLPQYEMVDVEMVDCMIRILDFLGQKGVDVEKIFRDKMEFNRVREDHKMENRMREGGKRY